MVSLFEPITRRFTKVKLNEEDLIYDPVPENEQGKLRFTHRAIGHVS